MKNASNTKRYSANDLEALRSQDASRSDFARVRAKTEAELEQDIAADPDFSNQQRNWYETAEAIMPATKQALSLRLDSDVIAWFRSQGPGYQTRINAVLRAFVAHQSGR